MTIQELSKIDTSNYWLTVTSDGILKSEKKDNIFVRWVKTIIIVLSCGYIDMYANVHINKVTQTILSQFEKTTITQEYPYYLALVDNLLENSTIKRYRKDLEVLRSRISKAVPSDKMTKTREVLATHPEQIAKTKKTLSF